MAYTLQQMQENATFAMNYLVSNYYTPMNAAAIVGNLLAESNLNFDTKPGDNGTAHGIAQWRNERVTKFIEIINRTIEEASLEEQLRFVVWELNNTHKKADSLLRSASTIEDATYAIDKYYERSFGEHLQKRITLAKEQYALYLEARNKEITVTEVQEESLPLKEEIRSTAAVNLNPISTEVVVSLPTEKSKSIFQIIIDLINTLFKGK